MNQPMMLRGRSRSMVRTATAFAGIVLALVLAGTTTMRAADADAGSLDLDRELAELIGLHAGGAVALAMRDGEIVTGVTGFADADGTPMTVDTGFRVSWFSMNFVDAVILQLVDEGRLDLEAPLSTYLPDVPVGGDATIRELLTQDANLSDVMGELLPRYLEDPSHSWTTEEIVELAVVAAEGRDAEDGALSITPHVLLVRLIEVLEGDFDEAFQRRIVEPLGLEGTSVSAARLADAPMAGGWLPELGLEGQLDIGGLETIAGTRTTAGDVATFVSALRGGELVSAELAEEIFSLGEGPITLGGFFPPAGLRYPGTEYIGSAGSEITGFSMELLVDPGNGDIALVVTNDNRIDPKPVIDAILESWDVALNEPDTSSTEGVATQDGEAFPFEELPISYTWEIGEWPQDSDWGTYDEQTGEIRGMSSEQIAVTASDPRFDGVAWVTANGQRARDNGRSLLLESRSYRFVDRFCSWTGEGTFVLFGEPPAPPSLVQEMIVGTGEGACEGLSFVSSGDYSANDTGEIIIFANPVPPVPELPAPTTVDAD